MANYTFADGVLTLFGNEVETDYTSSERPVWESEIENFCGSLKSVVFECNPTRIGNYAFSNCESLESITIPAGVTAIGEYAFYYCGSLTEIILPISLRAIENHAFESCYSVREITIPEGVETIGDFAFSCFDSIYEVTIPSTVTSIGNCAFDCYVLEDIYILGSDVSIYDSEYTIKQNAVIHGNPGSTAQSYAEKYSRKFIQIGDILTGIEITNLPNKINYITGESFNKAGLIISALWQNSGKIEIDSYDCTITGFDSTTAGEKTIEITYETFSASFTVYVKQATWTFEDGALTLGENEIDAIEANYSSYSRPIWEKGINNFKNLLTSVVFECNPGKLGRYLFYNCASLSSITIPRTVTLIENYSFYSCGLQNIYILNPNTEIYDNKYTIPEGAIIYGQSDSTAQYYAEKYSRTFVSIPASFTVKFLGFDGSVLKEEIISQNEDATPPEIPEIEGHEFCGWDGDYTNVTSDIEIRAIYQILKYEVKWYGINKALVKTEIVSYNESGTPPEIESIEHYTLTGWDKDYEHVKSDLELYPVYELDSYTVTWIGSEGAELKTETVMYLEDAVPPTPPSVEGYIFKKWDKSYENITQNTIITAIYTACTSLEGIDIHSPVENVNAGETIFIKFSLIPENATDAAVYISDYSDNISATLSINQNIIICDLINEGDASITLTSGSISATSTFSVVSDTEVSVLHIFPQEMMMQKGQSESIGVNVYGGDDLDNSVIFSSSIPSVATVDSTGVIRAVSEGETTITAISKGNAILQDYCKVTVEDKRDYIINAYDQDSFHKSIIIHSVSGKFADITDEHIVAESMTIKESICDSSTLRLGGCISNYFEIEVFDKRLFEKEPTGEIQVYQVIGSTKIELFNGIIHSAKKDKNLLRRKIIAYDKLYSKGDINISGWFKKLKKPLTVKEFRDKLFQKIGITQQKVKLEIDKCKILPATYKVKDTVVDINTGEIVDKKTNKVDRYKISDQIKASDAIRDLCECAGMCGWMNRKGVFEYIDLLDTNYSEDEHDYTIENTISFVHDENFYKCKCVSVSIDDYKFLEGSYVAGIEDMELIDQDGSSLGNISVEVLADYKSEPENATYVIDDSNFVLQITNDESDRQTGSYPEIAYEVYRRVQHDYPGFMCVKRFNPYLKLGCKISKKLIKELTDGTAYEWNFSGTVFSRTLKGTQSIKETISAKNAPFNGMNDSSKRNRKQTSIITEYHRERLNNLKNTKLQGVGVTREEYNAMEINESDTMVYFVRDE